MVQFFLFAAAVFFGFIAVSISVWIYGAARESMMGFFNPNPYPGAVEEAAQYCEENRLNTAWGHRFEEVRRRAAYYRAWPNCQDEISYYICGDGVREP